MAKVLVIVPFAFDDDGIQNRRSQLDSVTFGPDIEFDFRGVKAGPALLDSYHDFLLSDLACFEAAIGAQDDGYDAVCIDTISDSGMNAMRSVLDIPVIGPGRASYLMALMMGNRFSIVTQWDGWIPAYKKSAQEYGMNDRLASVRSINVMPDVANLLGGKEEVVFPLLVECATQCIEEDGAEVILLGSTTMHQAHGHMTENLPVPVINPGPLTYKMAEMFLGLGLTHSRKAYPKPSVPKPNMVHSMMGAAAKSSDA
jgi:allantoin racemase